jgi:hypothetical protein
MKKLLGIIFLLILPLFMASSQSEIKYIDSLKSVQVNVISNNPFAQPAHKAVVSKSTTSNNSQQLLTKAVDNQSIVNIALAKSITNITDNISDYIKQIEERNKSSDPPALITDSFGYSPQKVKHTIKIERWLNFITWILCAVYIIWTFNVKITLKYKNNEGLPDGLFGSMVTSQTLLQIVVWVFVFFFLRSILTLLFNGDFYVIKELINMYI